MYIQLSIQDAGVNAGEARRTDHPTTRLCGKHYRTHGFPGHMGEIEVPDGIVLIKTDEQLVVTDGDVAGHVFNTGIRG